MNKRGNEELTSIGLKKEAYSLFRILSIALISRIASTRYTCCKIPITRKANNMVSRVSSVITGELVSSFDPYNDLLR